MLQGILIVVAFLVVAALMMTKKIPTLLALPLMAVVICIIAGVPMFADVRQKRGRRRDRLADHRV